MKAEAWSISFASTRKISKREKLALAQNQTRGTVPSGTGEDDEVPGKSDALPFVHVVADLDTLVPRGLDSTKESLLERLHFDVPRLLCIAKQYPRSCGVTSLTSVWNFLYSRLGSGTLPPVSQEEVMCLLGFQPPFDDIRWGPFTGNTTLMRWFHAINTHFGVVGKCFYLWKVHGLGRTIGIERDDALSLLKNTLKNPNAAVIYHCHNHYMVPIGFQDIPRSQLDAYRCGVNPHDCDTTVFIGEVSRGKHPAVHAKKWNDIAMDLRTEFPNYVNIRSAQPALQTRPNSSRKGGNIHCLLCFRSDMVEEDISQFQLQEDSEEDSVSSGHDSATPTTALEE
jgi:hypothetical protein